MFHTLGNLRRVAAGHQRPAGGRVKLGSLLTSIAREAGEPTDTEVKLFDQLPDKTPAEPMARAKGIDMLSTLITHKFGSLPDWARSRLEQAEQEDLQRWTLKILDAQSIEDVFEE